MKLRKLLELSQGCPSLHPKACPPVNLSLSLSISVNFTSSLGLSVPHVRHLRNESEDTTWGVLRGLFRDPMGRVTGAGERQSDSPRGSVQRC